MTLHRRLIVAVTVLIVFLLGANLVITLHNARLNIYEQLKIHAEDAATSLGFSMSQAALDKDNVQLTLMVDAIFDRGYYRRITFSDLDNNELVERELPLESPDVPSWFIRWLPLPEPAGVADVSSGWFQLGQVEVVSHPGFAYQELWRSFNEQVWLFLVTAVICYGLLGVGLGVVLRPLRKVEDQAEAICRKEFSVQEPLPDIPELRRVVTAMNRMVGKVKEMFQYHIEMNDRLDQQLNIDLVTGLSNRQAFDRQFTAACDIDRAAAGGILFLIRVAQLQSLNMRRGREQGDQYLRQVANTLQSYLQAHASLSDDYILSHHSGSDFALFVPSVGSYESQQLLEDIYAALQEVEWQHDELQPLFIGGLYIPDLTVENNFMTLADAALSQAQSEGKNGYYWYKADNASQALTAKEWFEIIQAAINEQSFMFHYQPVWQLVHGEKKLLFNEITTSLDQGEQEYSAGAFMPMAARFNLLTAIDRLIFSKVVSGLQVLPENICLNLSIASLDDVDFMGELIQALDSNDGLAQRLTFELPANGLSFAAATIREFAKRIKSRGAKLSLHHFGRGSAEFAYFQSLPVDYLKIDRQFIQNVPESKDAQFFVRSLIAIAHSCDITVLAEGVENLEQWQSLIGLGIQGGQGFYLGKPSSEHIVG